MSRRLRTRSREIALQVLYQADLGGDGVLDGLEATLREDGHPEEVLGYAFALARGVRGRVAEIDAFIAAAAQHWSVHRMAVVDRNVLRIGIEEFLAHPDVPPRVAINEAIELAKRFSTGSSGAFVNGVLDRVRRDLEAAGRLAPAPAAPAAPDAAAAPDAPEAP
jgi:transcription antitermination factor NusB